MKFLSHFFSWVFLPLLMPSYGILISLFVPAYSADLEMTSLYFAPIESKWALFTIFFLFSVVAPGVSFVLLHRFKVISTIDIEILFKPVASLRCNVRLKFKNRFRSQFTK